MPAMASTIRGTLLASLYDGMTMTTLAMKQYYHEKLTPIPSLW